MLRTQSHKTREENEKLKKKNKKLQNRNKLISEQAYKEKYKRLKVLHTTQANVDTLLQVAEVAEDY